ncbi:MAG: ZinT/AdcA family metal-binding protein [Treponema sp.]
MLLKRITRYSAAALAVCAVLLNGCTSTPNKMSATDTMDLESGKELGQWKGSWQSFSMVTAASELDAAYKNAAKDLAYYTEAGLKAAVASMYASPIVKAKFDGSNTVLFTVADADGHEKEIACEYRYLGTKPMEGYADHSWYTFEAVKPVRGLSQAQYFIAVPPHQHGEKGLLHWHGRFGARGVDSLVSGDPMWWPTYVDAAMSRKDLVAQFEKTIAAVVGMLPAEPFVTYKGKWLNTSLMYDDMRPAIQNAYDMLIKEFAGQNKGGDFTKAEIIALAKKAYGDAEDFTHLEFVASEGKNELIVWKDTMEVSRVAYKRDAPNEARPTLKAFSAVDTKAAKKFAYFSATTPGGQPTHTHLWYGASPADAGMLKVKPTCIPADSSEADIALRVTNTCRKLLKEVASK